MRVKVRDIAGFFMFFTLIFFSSCAVLPSPIQERDRPFEPGFILTNCCRVLYRSPLDMKQFSRQLGLDSTQEIHSKVDELFERVKSILKINKKGAGVVDIDIYRNQDELEKVYLRVIGRKGRESAFYVAKTNTIYLSLDELTEGVLAHEMAHDIIQHFFTPLPLFWVREQMAQDVEKELRNKDRWAE